METPFHGDGIMGARGPKPTPTAVLAKRGSWRANDNQGEPLPDKCLPPVPPDLKGVAMEVWQTYEPILFRLGILTEIDGLAFEQLCKIYAQWKKYDQYLTKNGELQIIRYENKRIKERRLHPYVKLRQKAQEQLSRALADFGLNPSARSRISAEPPSSSTRRTIK